MTPSGIAVRHPRQFLRVASLMTSLVASLVMAASAQAQANNSGPGIVRIAIRTVDGLPLAGAQVQRADGGVVFESDTRGVASAQRIPGSGVWLRVRRIGYRPDSVFASALAGKTVDTSLALQRVEVELVPVTVFGRATLRGPLAGFYARQASGNGRFLSRADIERRNATRMTDLLRDIPGFRVEARGQRNALRIRGSRCSPMVWLDGQPLSAMEVDLDTFEPNSFEAIEAYSGGASVPVEFQSNQRISSSCGTLVLWSRRGELPESRSKKGEPSPAARIATLLEELKVFPASDVDVVARIDSVILVRPQYPDSMFEANTAGRVLAEFVVGTDGVVLIETFNAVTATHNAFVEPVRRALRDQRFFPAQRQGRPVQQIVQQPFTFVPDSTVRRKP